MPSRPAISDDRLPSPEHSPGGISRRREHETKRGFALLITVTLLAFLVLLLVSLASLTRVETQVAANSQQLSQARQNALMALNIAIGQLQKYTGPDQRTTARADLQNTPGQTNAQWTGVYGSAVKADYNADPVSIATDLTDTTKIAVDPSKPTNISANTGSPARLLNWLVSGNETTAFNPAWSTGDVGDKGQITGSPAPGFKPDGVVDNLTATSTATDTNIKVTKADGTTKADARLLVGGNSVVSSFTGTKPIDYVVAPAVDIQAPAPGQSGNVTIGRYAWWVGDEGMKARVNLPLAGTDPTLSASDKLTQQQNAFSNSTRDAIELMASTTPALASTVPALDAARIDSIDNAYGADFTKISKIVSPSQSALASSASSSAMASALKYRFHDITTQSLSVLSDTYAGGLKRDLSILLDSSYNASAAADPTTANTSRMWVKHSGDTGGFVAGGGFEIPTWKHLRSYYQTRIPTTGANKYSLPARLPANDKTGFADDVGVGPVITYFALGFAAGPTAPPAPGSVVPINLKLYPLVVLWNPYNFTIKAPAADATGGNYEVGIYPIYNVQVTLQVGIPNTSTGTIDWKNRGFMNLQKLYPTPNGGGNGNITRFRLNCPDIPPGQSLIFSLPDTSSGGIYNQRNILENIDPEPSAYVSVPFRLTPSNNSAVTIQAGEEGLNYQLTSNKDGTGYGTGSSFRSGGGIDAMYVGAPNNATSLTVTASGVNPSNPSLKWYNVAEQTDWSGLGVYDPTTKTLVPPSDPIQEPGPLVYDLTTSEPAYVFQKQALFAGQGQNAQLNGNQYMFSTRWLAQGNMRATRSDRTRRDNNFNPLMTATAGQPASASGFPWQKFSNGPGSASNRTSAGQGHDWINGTPVDVTLFEFPYDNQPLQSIGQLQHANLSLVGAYPSYPVGNSLADFRLGGAGGSQFPSVPQGWQLARVDKGISANGTKYLGTDMNGYYDISYLLNRTLWDRYYFSTAPATGSIAAADTLPNTRHLRYDTTVNLQDPDKSASGLVLAGGFNINSTSEQAWRAVLGGSNQLTFDPQNPDSASANVLKATFPRFTRPNAGDDPNDAWKGYRTLDADQIAQLARNIVTEIRNRGPFVSLADFINRRLMDNTGTAGEDETYRGPLQAAIDSTATSATSGQYPANDGAGTFWSQDSLIPNMGNYVNQKSQFDYGYYSQPELQGRFVNSATAATKAVKPPGARCAFAPKYITQADILAKIGASLSARSDTFTVRTYGEVVNPTNSTDITGRAWCEAVVQRLPDFIESTTNRWATPAAGSASQTFGRKFKIISFRWLSPNDI